MNDQSTSNKPAAVFRYGNIKATVWGNQTEHGLRYSIKLTRSYNKDGQWSDTDSFGRGDLFKAIEALRDAGRFVLSAKSGSASSDVQASASTPPGQYN